MRSLSTKIEIGYLFFAVLIIAVAVFSIYHIKQLSQPLYTLLRGRYENVTAAEKMLSVLQTQEALQFRMVENGPDTSYMNLYNKEKKEFDFWRTNAEKHISLPQEPVLLDSITNLYNLYKEESQALQQYLFEGVSYKERKRIHTTRIVPLVIKISSLIHDLQEVNEIAIERTERRSEKLSSRATWLIIIFTFIAISFGIAAGKYFTSLIIRPLKETTEKVKRISHGNLEQKLDIRTSDELEDLAVEFNRMTARLAEYEKLNVEKILTEKKKAEAIVEGIPVGILVLDETGRIVLLNEQAGKIFNADKSKLLNQSVDELDISPGLLQKIKYADQNEDEKKADFLISIKIGEQASFFTVRRIQLFVEGRKKIGSVILFQDVTPFKELDNLRSEFIEAISHEIKTPLTSLNMAIDILLRGVQGSVNQVQKELLEDARNDVDRMKAFVKELLDLAKLESGKYPLLYEKTDIGVIVQKTMRSFKRLAGEKAITLKRETAEAIPQVDADPHLISRVVSNLLKNAIEYSPRGSQVTINVLADKDNLHVCVSDEGKGIPDDALGIIFDKFVRLGKDGENVGLGLSIAREVIRMHNGRIWAENKTDKGSRFCFTIPIRADRNWYKKSDNTEKT